MLKIIGTKLKKK